MVGIVVVSHSDELARGVVAVAREMGGEGLAILAAGGTSEPGVLGTDAERVRAAIAETVNHASNEFLTRSGLALDHNGRIRGRNARDGLVNLNHARGGADHLGFRKFFGLDFVINRLARVDRVLIQPAAARAERE